MIKFQKWQGRIAQGYVDKEFFKMKDNFENYPIPYTKFEIDGDVLADLVEDIDGAIVKAS